MSVERTYWGSDFDPTAHYTKAFTNETRPTYGSMISEAKALEVLESVGGDELYNNALNRVRYRFDQCKPVKPKFHKGQYGKKYDSYTCGNCGHTVEVINNYCPNCGYGIKWDNPRCLTGVEND